MDAEIPWHEVKWAAGIMCVVLILISSWIMILRRQVAWRTSELLKEKIALERSERLFSSYMDGINAYVYIKDKDSNYTFINKMTEELFNVTRAELGNRRYTDYDFFDNKMAQQLRANDRHIMDTGNVMEFEEVGYPKGLHETGCKYYLALKFPLKDERDNIAGVCGFSYDITKQKAMEEELKNSKSDLDLAQSIAHIGSWRVVFSDDGDKWSGSDELYNIYGHPRNMKLTMQTGIDSMHPKDKASVMKSWSAAMNGGGPGEWEHRIIVDGQIKWVYVRVQFLFDNEGRAKEAVGILQDVTERKLVEEELNGVSEQLFKIMESTRDVIAMMDTEYRYVMFNTAFHDEFKRIFGVDLNKGDSMRQALADLPDDLANAMDFWGRALGGEDFTVTQQFGDTKLDRSWYELHFSPVRDTEGKVMGAVHVVRNVTRRKRMEEELRRLNIELESAVVEETQKRRQHEQMLIQQSKMAAMGEMISMISHQWRQPLNAIGMTVQDINEAYNFGELNADYIKNTVDTTMNQVHFMSKTIDDFKDFFKPSKAKVKFNVKTTIEELLSMFEQMFKKSDVDISIRTGQDTILITDGYPNEFKHVILNIINNAKDAITSKRDDGEMIQGRIDINIINNTEIDKIIISIKDNGGGIPEHIINNIFDPYYTTKGEKGTGIGLYMSKTIIETNMGGSLEVSNVDGGAEFVITLGAGHPSTGSG
ncbi:PAS domain-containing protein [Candidatus Magnetominusculus dajiuhuensis]|uniref:PAS domain-containing protein n=1 Tax=Candidatus Magnetominusculus dajiuhuensis TaxID=3137712 RepID=UPI003B436E7B